MRSVRIEQARALPGILPKMRQTKQSEASSRNMIAPFESLDRVNFPTKYGVSHFHQYTRTRRIFQNVEGPFRR